MTRLLVLALLVLPGLADAVTVKGVVLEPCDTYRFADGTLDLPPPATLLVQRGKKARRVYADPRLVPGETVLVRGRRDAQKIVQAETVTMLVPADVPRAVYSQERVVVIPLQFAAVPAARTVADLEDAWAETATFIANASAGRTTLDVQVLPWQTTTRSPMIACDFTTLMTEAVRHVDAVVDFRTATQVAVLIPLVDWWSGEWNCTGFRGYGAKAIGPVALATQDGTVLVGQFAMHEYQAADRHELGHGLGFKHANGLVCPDPGLPPQLPSDCASEEYGDPLDPMGRGYVGDFAAIFKMQAGWLEPQTVTVSGDYRLAPLAGTTGVRALRITRGTRPLMLENRWTVGNDALIPHLTLTNGVTVHTTVAPFFGQPAGDQHFVWASDTNHFRDAFIPLGTRMRVGPRWDIQPLTRETDGTLVVRLLDTTVRTPTPIHSPTPAATCTPQPITNVLPLASQWYPCEVP
jgi:hypothetical protein